MLKWVTACIVAFGIMLTFQVKAATKPKAEIASANVANSEVPFDPNTDCKVPYISTDVAKTCFAYEGVAISGQALSQARLTSWGSWIAALFAVGIAFFSLKTAQRAKEANRAWLLPDKIEGHYIDHWSGDFGEDDADDIISVKIPIKNVGKSPALKVSISAFGRMDKFPPQSTPGSKINLARTVSVLTPDDHYVVWVSFTDADGADILHGRYSGHIFVDVVYSDILAWGQRQFKAVYKVSCDTVGPDEHDVIVRELSGTKIK